VFFVFCNIIKKMAKVKVLIFWGYGINCEIESAYVFKLCGADPEVVHLSEIFSGKKSILGYHILCFPGGFLDGDHLGSAQACAHRFKYCKINNKRTLWDDLKLFLEEGGLVIGICNGFQLLVKMGLLPGGKYLGERVVTLTYNLSGKFEDRWVYLKVNPSTPCVFLKGLSELYLPVRHGEGNFVPSSAGILQELFSNGQVALQYINPHTGKPTQKYPYNPNGSVEGIAGICDPTGRIFGLMPHPEAFNHFTNHPRWTRVKHLAAQGLEIFHNAVTWVRENLF